MICPICRREIPDGTVHCEFCGVKVSAYRQIRYCKTCGRILKQGQEVCPTCEAERLAEQEEELQLFAPQSVIQKKDPELEDISALLARNLEAVMEDMPVEEEVPQEISEEATEEIAEEFSVPEEDFREEIAEEEDFLEEPTEVFEEESVEEDLIFAVPEEVSEEPEEILPEENLPELAEDPEEYSLEELYARAVAGSLLDDEDDTLLNEFLKEAETDEEAETAAETEAVAAETEAAMAAEEVAEVVAEPEAAAEAETVAEGEAETEVQEVAEEVVPIPTGDEEDFVEEFSEEEEELELFEVERPKELEAFEMIQGEILEDDPDADFQEDFTTFAAANFPEEEVSEEDEEFLEEMPMDEPVFMKEEPAAEDVYAEEEPMEEEEEEEEKPVPVRSLVRRQEKKKNPLPWLILVVLIIAGIALALTLFGKGSEDKKESSQTEASTPEETPEETPESSGEAQTTEEETTEVPATEEPATEETTTVPPTDAYEACVLKGVVTYSGRKYGIRITEGTPFTFVDHKKTPVSVTEITFAGDGEYYGYINQNVTVTGDIAMVDGVAMMTLADFTQKQDPNFVQNERELHRYELVRMDVTYEQAVAEAAARGGYLARITSEEEFNHVTGMISGQQLANVRFFVAGTRTNGGQDYYWTYPDGTFTGDLIDDPYSWCGPLWMAGGPSFTDNGRPETAVIIYFYDGEGRFVFNDVSKDYLTYDYNYCGYAGFIVEYDQ